MASSYLRSMAALTLGAIAMGASPIFVRLADVGPFTSAFWRISLAIPFFALWYWAEQKQRKNNDLEEKARTATKSGNQHLMILIALAGLLFAGDLTFWHLSIVNTSIGNATLLATMTPILVTLGAWIILKDKITPAILIGVGLGFMGAALLVGATAKFIPENLDGDIYGIITAFFFGSYTLTIALARRNLSVGQVMLFPTLITAVILLFIALLLEDQFWPQTMESLLALIALALVSQVLGQGLFAYALGHLPAIFSSLILFLEALAAMILAWIIFGEEISAAQIIGGILIFIGIYCARPRRDIARPKNS